MKSKAPEIADLRRKMIRILQFMNKYQLREFEYSSQDSPGSIHLLRGEEDASSPLLEGRSKAVPGQIYAPDVGFLSWECEPGDAVREGEMMGQLKKQEELLEINSPMDGVVDYLTEARKVEFGERIAEVSSIEETDEQ